MMDPETYLKERVDDQIDWYDRRSQSNQRMYKRLRATEIVLAASIPFFAGFIKDVPQFGMVVGILGVLVAVLAGFMGMQRYQELWQEYRTTCESLRQEKYLFLARIAEYAQSEQPFSDFVTRIEGLLTKQQRRWQERTGEQSRQN